MPLNSFLFFVGDLQCGPVCAVSFGLGSVADGQNKLQNHDPSPTKDRSFGDDDAGESTDISATARG
jgi:hypothetical protein